MRIRMLIASRDLREEDVLIVDLCLFHLIRSQERTDSANQVINRLRIKLANEPGATLFLMPVQDVRAGGRQANASYQFTLLADDLSELRKWEPLIRKALGELPELVDVNSDKEDKRCRKWHSYDRDTMSQLGINVSDANNLLNNAFGQRQISTIYAPLNQYKVVMEVSRTIYARCFCTR